MLWMFMQLAMAADPQAMVDRITAHAQTMPELVGHRIEVQATGGAITLTGRVPDTATRDELVLFARGLDGVTDVVSELSAEIAKITVTELRENTFYALITLRAAASEIEIDSRPSDALALAVRSNAPIFAADKVIEESGIEFEHEVEDTDEVVEKFKEFLDQVSPEDFLSDE